MNVPQWERLKAEQEKGLTTCRANIERWKKFKSDYEVLKTQLQVLPDKVSHEIMVPLGPVAFMPGRLIHTNEVTVLLGDNWFAERSAKQSLGIVDRRIASCDEMLKKLHQEESQFSKWMDYTQQVQDESSDYVEIVEEYDEDKERAWRAQHKKNVREAKQREKDRSVDLDEIFDRLEDDELLEEDLNDDGTNDAESAIWEKGQESDVSINCKENDDLLNVSSASELSSNMGVTHRKERRVSWHEDPVAAVHAAEDDTEVQPPIMIYITHMSEPTSCDSIKTVKNSEDTPAIGCPSDIYVHFAPWFKKVPKSILKSKPVVRAADLEMSPLDEIKESKSPRFLPSPTSPLISPSEAFSEFVVEKEPSDVQLPAMTKRPLSKYKAQKQKLLDEGR